MLDIFGRCPKCGLKFGRKTTYCYNCLAHTVPLKESTDQTIKPNIVLRFIPLVFAVVVCLIFLIFLRAQRLGVALW